MENGGILLEGLVELLHPDSYINTNMFLSIRNIIVNYSDVQIEYVQDS